MHSSLTYQVCLPGIFLDTVYGWRSRRPIVCWSRVLHPVVIGLRKSIMKRPVGFRVGSCCVQSIIVSLVCKRATLTGRSLQISNTWCVKSALRNIQLAVSDRSAQKSCKPPPILRKLPPVEVALLLAQIPTSVGGSSLRLEKSF